MSTVNGYGLLAAEIRMPRTGTWHADIEVDADADISGAVEIVIDGVTFIGKALPDRSGLNGTRQVARVVGGAGGLSAELPARSYESPQGVKASTVIGDILRECGETLSETADAATLAKKVARWHRSGGDDTGSAIASHSLTRFLDRLGADWRVLADGTIWVGETEWEAATVTHVLEDEDWANGFITIAPESPSLTPGVTFLDQRIEQVVHRVGQEGELRTEAHIVSTRSVLSRFLGRIRKEIDYSRLYRCRVAQQNADGTLQLVPDDEVMKARGLDKVPIRLGLPGFSVEVPSGARVMLGFSGGDPEQPFAALWDSETEVTRVRIDGDDADVARVGDQVDIYFSDGMLVTGEVTIGGTPSPFFGTITFTNPSVGIVATGTTKFGA